MARATRWLLPAVALVLAGCGRLEAPPSGSAPPRVASAAAAVEGMCAQHGVLEVVCTRCNPALIPVFQAKGDWCAEHGFPESFCPACHPERGGKPAADVGVDDSEDPRDGTVVRFKSSRSAELAGIETARAQPASGATGIAIPATLVADASRVALVNARLSGVLKEVRAEVGADVRRGDVLAVLTSSEAGALHSRMVAAEARARAARSEQERERKLRDQHISSEQDFVAATRNLEEAEAELAGARAEVGVLGSVGQGGSYTLKSPRDGVVLERAGSVGELVHPEETLFRIVDPSVLWLELDVPERQLEQVLRGAEVEVPVRDGFTIARIDFVSPVLDPHARTARARATLANDAGSFHINSRIKVRVRGVAAEGATVPALAVQRIGEHDVVFLRKAADVFELTRVTVSSREADLILVATGLSGGEEIATTGSFLLKTEVQKASIGSGCCEVE